MIDPEPVQSSIPMAADDDPQDTPELVKHTTHEVDTDDMFVQGGE